MGNNFNSDIDLEYRQKLLQAIQVVSPSITLEQIDINLVLKTIPDWDSLTAINFSISIEGIFGLPAGTAVFIGDDSIETVITRIKEIQAGISK